MEGMEVVIRTDKNEYVGGDTIYGSLYLCVPSGCTATSLKLVIRGHELCEYDYQYVLQQDSLQAKIGQRKARKDLIRVEQKLVEYPGGFPEGYFAYPFRYQLPHGLSGVFNSKYEDARTGRVWQGLIKYMLAALVETADMPPNHRLMGETSFVVLDSVECSDLNSNSRRSEVSSAVGSVKTFFCIHRGDIKVSSSLDKLAYEPQDKVTINLHIENNSAVDVSGSTIKVIRVIKLYGLDRAREEEEFSAHTVYDTVIEVMHSGCLRNSIKKSSVDLELKSSLELGLPSTTSGSLIKCSYVVDIAVHVPWAPDIEVRSPLLIKPTTDKDDWKAWQPPEWVMKCTQEQVAGLCAVPENILESQSFSGMPSFQPVL